MKYPAFLLTALLFLSCINVNKREYPSADMDVEREDAQTEMLADTAKNETSSEEEQAKETASPASASEKGSTTSSSATNKKSSSATSSRSSSSSRYSDNMRGFDPASEDDMDDNGMSRYMENDDDEGWD
jgi:hypothetical protein